MAGLSEQVLSQIDLSAIQMIATDIDGTILRSDGSLSPQVRKALHEAVEAGIEVVPATGRPQGVAEDVVRNLGLGGHWVFANGALTYNFNRGEVVRCFQIEADTAVALVRRMRAAFPEVSFGAELQEGTVFETAFSDIVGISSDQVVAGDLADFITGGEWTVLKLLVTTRSLELDALYGDLGGLLDGEAFVTRSGMPFVEVASADVHKARALDLLVTDLGIDPKAVVAFGDHDNDVAMLRWAGLGLAMGNASLLAKAAADYGVGASDEDAVARVIDQILSRR